MPARRRATRDDARRGIEFQAGRQPGGGKRDRPLARAGDSEKKRRARPHAGELGPVDPRRGGRGRREQVGRLLEPAGGEDRRAALVGNLDVDPVGEILAVAVAGISREQRERAHALEVDRERSRAIAGAHDAAVPQHAVIASTLSTPVEAWPRLRAPPGGSSRARPSSSRMIEMKRARADARANFSPPMRNRAPVAEQFATATPGRSRCIAERSTS